MEIDNKLDLLQLEIYKTDFKKQDVSKTETFIHWNNIQKKKGNKIVRCPACWSYEISKNEYRHKCQNCQELYCQKCLKYLENNREHDHPLNCCDEGCSVCCINCCRDCCEGLCDLLDLIIFSYNKHLESWKIILLNLLFLFGTPIMFTIKYLIFFCNNKVIDNLCVHWFFTVLNFITNIIYCIIFFFIYIGICFVFILPGIIFYPWLGFIAGNWYYVFGYTIDECPIVQLTVRTRSF